MSDDEGGEGVKEIDIQVGAYGEKCRVTVDGEDLPVRKFVIVGKVHQATRVFLDCVKPTGEPYRIKGRMIAEEPD